MFRTLTALIFFMLINVLTITQAATPAGVRIYNQAEASYFDTETGQIFYITSNTATFVVAPILAVVQNQDQTQHATAAQPVYFPHTIINTGNQGDYYLITVENLGGDNGDLENLRIYLDENGDGQVNPGERLLTQTDLMQPGTRIQIIVAGDVPPHAQNGDQYSIQLITTSVNDPSVRDMDVDTVAVTDGPIIRITRQSDVDCNIHMQLNDRSYHEISFTNIGNQMPAERTLIVGGLALQGVLIEDALPQNFQLQKEPAFFAIPSQGITLVGTPLGEWLEYSQWDGISTISKIGVLMPAAQLKPNQSGKFGYTLKVVKLPTSFSVLNLQTLIDTNVDGRNEFQSNTACNSLVAGEPLIKGRDYQDIQGSVFDSARLEGISGAKVELFTVSDNLLVAETISGENGHYILANIPLGDYYIRVTPPANYTAPSTHPPQEFYTYQVLQASYGLNGYVPAGETGGSQAGMISLTDASDGIVVDIPLDLNGVHGQMAIEKQASTATVALGELVAYTVRIHNISEQDVYAVWIRDQLPAGFKYVGSTAKLNGTPIDDPEMQATSGGTRLNFRVGDFPLDDEATLTYLVQVTALASGSNGINTAYAEGYTITNLLIRSPTASAQVDIKQTGVLSDRAILFGRLALAKGCPVGSEEQQAQGYPLADIRLYMEDGTYVVTDPNGQYSLYGLQPGVHVLKIDQHSVPEGLEFTLTDNAQAGDPDSRFVDLVPGDFYRADFVAACPEAQTRTIQECREASTKQVQQCEQKPVMSSTTEVVTRTVPNPVAPVHFDSGKAIILPEYLQKLNRLVAMTRDKKNVRFRFVGHTDNQHLKPETKAKFGTNQGLSEARAQEVAEYVLKNLELKTQISVDGKGDTQPVASNDNPQGMAQNRRVELHMIYDEEISKPVTQMKEACTTKTVQDSSKPAGCTTRTVTEPNPVMNALLTRSKTSQKGWNTEIDSLDPANADNLKNLARFADKNGDISNGLLEAHQQQVKKLQNDFAQEQAAEEKLAPEARIPDPKEAVKTITAAQGKEGTWLWPLDDTSLDGRFMVVVRSGVDPVLTVNGKPVANSQLGEQIVNKREKAQILAWYGVDLQEGENQLKVTAKDSFGNERTLTEKTFKRPSAGVAIKMTVDGTLMADRGRSTVPVNIEVVDIHGYPAKGTYFLTLEASDGSWAEPDIQDKVAGHQVKITNGKRTVHLRSSGTSGEIKLTASTGTLQSEADLTQIAEMRPLVAVGLLDLRAHRGYRDGYENLGLGQLDDAARDTEVSGRAAIFLKGRVRGDMHLTMAYDSEKDKDAELLRDIDPAEYYRVYGDSSQRGFEAQSRSKLYAKLERDRHSIMWGDYITDNEAGTADIARTSRTLTGLNGIYDNGKTRLQVFASEPDNLRGYEEFPGNGTAMQYQLQGTPIVRNSEVVEIVTRDRENSGLIIATETLQRFRDYSLDDVSGYMTFHRSIPSVDDELNPVFIRISYDRVEKGDNYLVAGVRLLHRYSDNLSVGASYTSDQHETEGYALSGVFAEYKNGGTELKAGMASMTHADGSEDGRAIRLQATKKWNDKATTELTAAQADAGYTNSSSGVIADRREIKLSHQQKLGKNLEGKAELTHSESLSTEQQRQTAELSVTTQLEDWKLKGGIRQIHESDDTTDETVNTALVGVERKIEVFGRKGSIKGEYEREIGDQDRQRASIGTELQLTDKTKAYLRYEQSDRIASGTLSGAVDTSNTLVAGVKSQVLPSTEMYSEYRIEGDISGEDVVAVNGAKATLNLEENLVVTPGIEFMNYRGDSDKSDSVAASVGIRDTRDADSKKLLRLETRRSDDENFYGVNGTYVKKLNDSTTVMVQDELRYQDKKNGAEDTLQNTLTLAAAHRPQGDGNYNALYAYKWDRKDEDNTNTHILSTHQHYRVNDDLDVSGRLGGKKQILRHDSGDYTSTALLADARAQWDLTDRLSADLHGGMLTTNNSDEKLYSLGAGFSFNVLDNVRLGAGYNFSGFEDRDLDPESFNAQGAYIGLQMKMDEALFGWLTGEDQDECQSPYMAERELARQKGQSTAQQENCKNNNQNDKKAAGHE